MPTNVIMPQMGESIAEGTITRWLKKSGDSVKRDEPLFEISTDKVDAEIPAPVSGTLLEIKYPEGAVVAVNTVVAVMGESGEAVEAASAAVSAPAAPPAETPAAAPAAPRPAPPPGLASDAGASAAAPPANESQEDLLRRRSSPVVRAIAA